INLSRRIIWCSALIYRYLFQSVVVLSKEGRKVGISLLIRIINVLLAMSVSIRILLFTISIRSN
ncbi:MAG: hypothetical protein K8S56_04370, partial [Candidatus Cloacimonetes bacterium]|nr:hypothetical protein [Candidatus Cloacimonadota bacterium]